MEYLVSHEALAAYCRAAFTQAGSSEQDAAATAELLVHGDLRGVYSHGVWPDA